MKEGGHTLAGELHIASLNWTVWLFSQIIADFED